MVGLTASRVWPRQAANHEGCGASRPSALRGLARCQARPRAARSTRGPSRSLQIGRRDARARSFTHPLAASCDALVTQAPTTQGVEPDFFFWRAAGARRCSRAGRLREGKRPGQRSSCWPRASRLTVLIKPAAEVAGQPARGRGVASERRVARTWPALGGARADPLPSEARDASWRRRASLGTTAFFQ